MFENSKFINKIFEICFEIENSKETITAKKVFAKTSSNTQEGKDDYRHNKNIAEALSIIELMKLIRGRIEPEYTKNHGFLLEVRHAKISKWGHLFRRLPRQLKYIYVSLYLWRKNALSILGALAFLKLGNNALQGAKIVANLYEFILATILLYIIYVIFKRLIG